MVVKLGLRSVGLVLGLVLACTADPVGGNFFGFTAEDFCPLLFVKSCL